MTTDAPVTATFVDSLRTSGGETGKLIAVHDWSQTSLGAIETWSQSLRTALGILIRSPVPMVMLWGVDGVMLYNDAYSVFAGGRHPYLLGSKVREGWPEVAEFNDNVMRVGLAGGTLAYSDQELTLHRSGVPEQVWMNLDYSPVPDESGKPAGVIAIVIETTQRVLAERRARAERERQQVLWRQMPGFVGIVTGPDHVYEYVNDAYIKISERGTDFVGKRFRDKFPELVGQGYFELLDEVYSRGETRVSRGMELRLHGGDEVQYIDFVFEPIRDEHQAVTGIFIGGYEVTEVHRAANVVRESEARLRQLNTELERQVIERAQARGMTWQVSPDLMGALNAQGYFETSNPAWMTVLGWTEAEVAATSIFDFLHPDDVERTRAGFELTQIGQPAIRFPNRYRCKDGSYRWISWVGVFEDGYVYCTGRDITEDKAAEAERDRLWTLSEDMLARADYSGGMSAVNPAWTKVLGWTEQELLTNPYADIINPDNVPATVAALMSMSETGQPTRFENLILAKDGQWKPIGWTVSPEPDGVNFIAVGRDLTEYKARESELSQAQDALRQAQKMEAVGQLTGGIAHDFNNMLAVVLGSLELLGRRVDPNDARAKHYVQAATDGAKRAANLTQRLLAFSRQQPLQPEQIDANKLVAGMSDLLRHSIGADVRLETVLAGGLWRIEVDPNQLESVILNLSVNARDAMPGGGRLTIETQNAHLDSRYVITEMGVPAGQYVLIAITDTGTGMPPDVIAKAFDPFFTTKEVGKGTGLGLSQVYGFVKQSGGHIKIYSEMGQGTSIKIYLPRVTGVSAAAEIVAVGEEALMGEQQEVVLVVDDEPAVRQFSADALSELGYRVFEADSAAAALVVLRAHPEIALLFTDIVMPDANGRALADQAQALRPDLKVLYTTGYTRNAVVHNGVVDKGVHLIGKPFSIDELAARVREVLDLG